MSHCACHECMKPEPERAVTNSTTAAALLRPFLRRRRVEFFYVAPLSTRLTPLGKPVRVSQGTINSALVHPREVFRPAIVRSAHAVLLGHCHPSGSVEPSPEDDALTRRLVSVGDLLGIKVIEHLVIGGGTDFYSYADAGRL